MISSHHVLIVAKTAIWISSSDVRNIKTGRKECFFPVDERKVDSVKNSLNVRQEKFCLEYASSGNACDAYMKAYKIPKGKRDYANACAIRLVHQQKIVQKLQDLSAEMKSEKIANASEMQEALTKIIRQELDEEVLMTEMVGDGMSETKKYKKKPCNKDVISAVDKLARIQGLYDQSNPLKVLIPVFTDEEKIPE